MSTLISSTTTAQLFTEIWTDSPRAQAARESLINLNLSRVVNVILDYAPTAWYEIEDARQEAYIILAQSIEKVPMDARNPGGYLYQTCRFAVKHLNKSLVGSKSLDAVLPGTESLTLHDTLPAPAHMGVCHSSREDVRVQALYAALRRLPLPLQYAVKHLYTLQDYNPTRWSQRVPRGTKSVVQIHRSTLINRKSVALKTLRNDSHLITALFA